MIQDKYYDFLTSDGKEIFDFIIEYLEENELLKSGDFFEVAVYANALDTYRKAAKVCNDKGNTQKPSNGGWDQVSPHYTIMKNEYQNILKHGSKFLLNADSRQRLFKGALNRKKKADPNSGLED